MNHQGYLVIMWDLERSPIAKGNDLTPNTPERLTIFRRWKRWRRSPWFPYILFSAMMIAGTIWQAYQYWWGVQLERWLNDGAGSANRVAVFPASWKAKIGPAYIEPFEPITHITLIGGRSSTITFSNGTTRKIVRPSPISPSDLRRLKWLPYLSNLQIYGELEPNSWEVLAELQQLKSLALPGTRNSKLTGLEKMYRLTELSIGIHEQTSLSEIKSIALIPRLRKLGLGVGGIRLPGQVTVGRTLLDQQMQQLATSRSITVIEATIPDDSVLLALTDRSPNGDFPLVKVSELRLSGSKISNAGLANLHNVPNLVHLDLSQTDVDDDGLDSIKSIPTLRTLYVAGCFSITDKAAEDLAEMTGLESLNVAGTRMTQAGLLKLGTLKRLRSLRSDVQVTPELRQCFPPNCKVDRR